MYVYIRNEFGIYTVGFYTPDGSWVPESDHATQQNAVKRVNYLNGGVDESAAMAAAMYIRGGMSR